MANDNNFNVDKLNLDPRFKVPAIHTKDMTDEKWLDMRQFSIGGSDAGTIVGLNKYESPYSLYFKKLGLIPKEDLSDRIPIIVGNYNEQLVADLFEKNTGKKVRKHNYMMYHPEYTFMSANVDRVLIGENAILECKTASEYVKDQWKNGEVPGSYMAQCYHYMAVTGAERVYIAVLIGNSDFKFVTIDRDEEIIQGLIESEREYWENHILKRVEPKTDGSDATKEALSQRWQSTNDHVKTLNEHVGDLLYQRDQLKAQEKDIKKDIQAIENEVKDIMEDSEVGIINNYKVTWKHSQRNTFDKKTFENDYPDLAIKYTKTTSSRPFTVKENKKGK